MSLFRQIAPPVRFIRARDEPDFQWIDSEAYLLLLRCVSARRDGSVPSYRCVPKVSRGSESSIWHVLRSTSLGKPCTDIL
jgi:hypothetical protein